MTVQSNRLNELFSRLREAFEIGSPLVVQQRLLCDFTVCLEMEGVKPPPFHLPLSQELLLNLESRLSQEAPEPATIRN